MGAATEQAHHCTETVLFMVDCMYIDTKICTIKLYDMIDLLAKDHNLGLVYSKHHEDRTACHRAYGSLCLPTIIPSYNEAFTGSLYFSIQHFQSMQVYSMSALVTTWSWALSWFLKRIHIFCRSKTLSGNMASAQPVEWVISRSSYLGSKEMTSGAGPAEPLTTS